MPETMAKPSQQVSPNPRPVSVYAACRVCIAQTFAGGGEERQMGAYA